MCHFSAKNFYRSLEILILILIFMFLFFITKTKISRKQNNFIFLSIDKIKLIIIIIDDNFEIRIKECTKKNFTSYKDIIQVVSNLEKRKEEQEKWKRKAWMEKYQFLNSCHRFLATFAFPISCTFLSFFSNICDTCKHLFQQFIFSFICFKW